MRSVLKSKIHRAWVTDNNPDDSGGIMIDRDLMEKTELTEHEKVLVCNATNGNRWETRVLPDDSGSGTVSVLGAGARLCNKRDCLTILGYELSDKPPEPKMILVDADNRFVEYLEASETKGEPDSHLFSEDDAERFYDAEDAHYRSFWDKGGSLHWGVFDESTGDDFLKACANLNAIMASKAEVNESSRVIDLGCGNGNTAMWLARTTGCRVVGVDLSGVRVQNANDELRNQPPELQERVAFEKASLTHLPFGNASSTLAWSQATIYHVPNKERALREAWRVLEEDGVFVFDDLIKPKPKVSERARKVVYDRLLFDTDYSFESYQQALKRVDFEVVEAVNLSEHLATSYARLAEIARLTPNQQNGHLTELSLVYEQMIQCIEDQDVGWAMYVCRKKRSGTK